MNPKLKQIVLGVLFCAVVTTAAVIITVGVHEEKRKQDKQFVFQHECCYSLSRINHKLEEVFEGNKRRDLYYIALEFEHLATLCEDHADWLSLGTENYTPFREFARFLLGPEGTAYIDLFRAEDASLSEKEIGFLRSLYDYNVKLIRILSQEEDVNTLRSMTPDLLKKTITEAAQELNRLFYINPPVV